MENLEQHEDPTSASLHLASCNHKDQKDAHNVPRKNWNMLFSQSIESNKKLENKDIGLLLFFYFYKKFKCCRLFVMIRSNYIITI